MGIAMDNNNQQDQSKPDGKSSKKDIPLWLQGLEETHPENLTENREEQGGESAWEKEITESPMPSNLPADPDISPHRQDTPDQSIPDWMNSQAIDNANPSIEPDDQAEDLSIPVNELDTGSDDPPRDEDTNEINVVEAWTDPSDDDEIQAEAEMNIKKEFIEISDLDIVDDHTDPIIMPTTEENPNEEIPDWLTAMVAEPDQKIDESIDVTDNTFDITKPIVVSEYPTSEPENEDPPSPLEETSPDDEEYIQTNEENLVDDEERWPAEEIGGAVIDSPEETPTSEEPDEVFADETKQIYTDYNGYDSLEPFFDEEKDGLQVQNITNEIPPTLLTAKNLLDEDETDQAVNMLTPFISQAAYLDEINTWLMEANTRGDHPNGAILEAMGDVAMAQNKPDDALKLYTRAIQLLTSEKKGSDGPD